MTYTQLFLSFLEHYDFEKTEFQSNKRSIFKAIMEEINPKIDERELNKLTHWIFHPDGNTLHKKRESFRRLLNGTIISSYNNARIYLFDTIMENNHLAYSLEENSSLGRSYISLYVNGINLVSIHINDKAPLHIVHKQYLHQLNHNTSRFEQTLFNVLYAEGEIYFGRVVKDLDHFNHIIEQPFHKMIQDEMVKNLINHPPCEGQHLLTYNFEKNEDLSRAFKHVNLILHQLWSILSISYALKTNLAFSRNH